MRQTLPIMRQTLPIAMDGLLGEKRGDRPYNGADRTVDDHLKGLSKRFTVATSGPIGIIDRFVTRR